MTNMNIEQNRLETFNNWPTDASVSPQRIAKAGFFFTQQAQEVECFSCGIKISSWNYGDQVMARHRALNPQCPFVLDPATSGNVPSVNSPTSSTPPFIPPEIPPTPDYKNESVRLATFENWPIPDIVQPDDLAKAGFYYLKTGDNTKCAFCKGVVRAWEPQDIPDVEHKRHFPGCPFVLTTINLRLEQSDNANVPQRRQQQESRTFKNINIIDNSVDSNLGDLGVQKHNGPKRPDYGTAEARLRTFGTWSPHLIQTPDLLAQAGFYYEGLGDQVRCFHCDGGLRHWDPDDDPWTEHARWFPQCSFVNLVKGQEFVTACALDTLNAGSTQQSDKIKTVQKVRRVTEEVLGAHMNSEAALMALGIGLDVQRVRRALKEKLQLTGRGFDQPDDLVEAALNIQLEEDDGSDTSSLSNNQIRETVTAVLSDITKGTEVNTGNQNGLTPEQNVPTTQQPSRVGRLDPNPADQLQKGLTLEEENRILKEQRQCKICMDAEVGIVFLPCGHLATCVVCAPNLEDCPVCRSAIKATVRTFLS